jgi:hypothetical protein
VCIRLVDKRATRRAVRAIEVGRCQRIDHLPTGVTPMLAIVGGTVELMLDPMFCDAKKTGYRAKAIDPRLIPVAN